MGGDIIAYDEKPYDNHWCGRTGQRDRDAVDVSLRMTSHSFDDDDDNEPRWTDVLIGKPKSLTKHCDRTLFLCWPPYRSRMASDCLRWHQSQRIIYVGEGSGGATGTDAFHARLIKDFEEIQTLAIPQWWGMHDWLWVYERKR
jgi:hypothetical protein